MKVYGKKIARRIYLLMAMALMASSSSGVHLASPRKKLAVKSYKKELPPNNPRREKYKKCNRDDTLTYS